MQLLDGILQLKITKEDISVEQLKVHPKILAGEVDKGEEGRTQQEE